MATAGAVAAAIRARLGTDPGRAKIHKLLYYCQGWHLAWTDAPLFDERIEAWDMGPVVADLWRAERSHGLATAEPLVAVEERTIGYVINRYGELWGSQLIGQTHEEAPWQEARSRGWNSALSLDVMRGFFLSDPAANQAWFWDRAWQLGELEAERDVHEGHTTRHLSSGDFLEALDTNRADV
ncbi:MAG: DUF4065 domain-containing protein [Acidimicrobiia bacterium]|jgi:uncharacterized phage-associated protein